MKRFNFYLDGVWQLIIVTNKPVETVRAECSARHPDRTIGLVDVAEDGFEEDED